MLDNCKSKRPLSVLSVFDYTCCTVPSSYPKQSPCAQRPRINSLAGDFKLLHGWPRPTDDFLFLSLRLWFQKLKTTRPRKINLSQFASENLNPIKSTLVVSGECYSSVSQGQAFGLSLALQLLLSALRGLEFPSFVILNHHSLLPLLSALATPST